MSFPVESLRRRIELARHYEAEGLRYAQLAEQEQLLREVFPNSWSPLLGLREYVTLHNCWAKREWAEALTWLLHTLRMKR
jgi:hypothetical protein